MREILPLITVFTRTKPNLHVQAGLGKALPWMPEVLPECISFFSELNDDCPFFWME